jgi:iron complex transport system permease protein
MQKPSPAPGARMAGMRCYTRRVEPRRSRAAAVPILIGLFALVLVFFVLHLGYGGTWLGPVDVVKSLIGTQPDEGMSTVVWEIRLPRALGCVLVGAILAVVGSSFQALFRNPLAEPYVVGVSSGAAVGGVAAFLLGFSGLWGGLGTMAAGFVTGMLSLLVVFAVARKRGVVEVKTLLLAGVVVGALLSALTTFGLLLAGQDSNKVLRWLLGSTSPMFWDRLAVMALALAVGGGILMSQARALNAFAVGEKTAQTLGVDVGRLKSLVLVTGTALAAVTVGAVGIIGFLGLIAPHIARRLVGVDWRVSMPAAMLAGAGVLLVSDVLAQRAVPGMDMPVGVVTALLGAPMLLVLLKAE